MILTLKVERWVPGSDYRCQVQIIEISMDGSEAVFLSSVPLGKARLIVEAMSLLRSFHAAIERWETLTDELRSC